ncbi:hypothetical protein [Jannaschia sp. W003]|uniref:hypothetical protein n=1 Tax=Jannaschia sp. W003 TaxID=2867012 RepID=UPI0021A43552|nr:hypothetical protein [Jannaschia sp. W003]UWQ21892.1 hypothetical protein K3554_02355 [Jannaschia sp. W003]
MPEEDFDPREGSRITPRDVLSGIESKDGKPGSVSRAERKYIEGFDRRSVSSQVAYEHLKGIRDHYNHKKKWSWLLMAAIGGMICFQGVLLWQVGEGDLDFTAYEWLLPALLVQNLGQVVGLAVYAVRYLFSDITNQKID